MIAERPIRINAGVVKELEVQEKYHIIIGNPGSPTALTICGLVVLKSEKVIVMIKEIFQYMLEEQ